MTSHPKQLLLDEGSGVAVLADPNGHPLMCAFRNPFLTVKKGLMKNETEVQESFCCSQCPHFHIGQKQERVTLTCSGLDVIHPIVKPKEEPLIKRLTPNAHRED